MDYTTAALNFIEGVDCPTTADFCDYFKMFNLFLQREAAQGRWDGICPDNFIIYDDSSLFSTEVGVKLCFVHYNFEVWIGVKFVIENATGIFKIFTKVDCPPDICLRELKIDKSCQSCDVRTICGGRQSPITRIVSTLYELYPDGDYISDEFGTEIGYEVKLSGYELLFHGFCDFLDRLNPILEILTNSHLNLDIENPYGDVSLWGLPVATHGILSGRYSNVMPHFRSCAKSAGTIEDIYSKRHGIEDEYSCEEPPF